MQGVFLNGNDFKLFLEIFRNSPHYKLAPVRNREYEYDLFLVISFC